MEMIQISNAAYDRIMSKRRGEESLSAVILREIKEDDDDRYDVEKLDAHLNRALKSSKKFYNLDEVL